MDDNNNSGGFGEVTERETDQSTDQSTQDVQTEESVDSQETTGTEETEETQTSQGTEDTEAQTDNQTQLTEKGTKLDPNPESAVHQQLANEKRVRSQMEQVLGNPQLLAKYMETQYGIKIPTNEGTQTQETQSKKYTAEDFENIGDVAETVNKIQDEFSNKINSVVEENKNLKKAVSDMVFNGRVTQIAQTMEKDVNTLRNIPELNPSNPAYIEGLEDEIAGMYHQLDFDEQTGMFRGAFSLKEIGDKMISAARKARAKGSLQAQTIVKDKIQGQVRTTSKANDTVDTDKMKPGDSIAAGIAKMFSKG